MSNGQRAALRSRMQRVGAEIDQCVTAEADLEEKIARLKAAKKIVSPIDGEVAAIRGKALDDCLVERWKGTRKDQFAEIAIELLENMDKYSAGADALYEHICDRITELENEKDGNSGILSGLRKTFNNMANEIDKFLN